MEQGGSWETTVTPELAAFLSELDMFYLGTANAVSFRQACNFLRAGPGDARQGGGMRGLRRRIPSAPEGGARGANERKGAGRADARTRVAIATMLAGTRGG